MGCDKLHTLCSVYGMLAALWLLYVMRAAAAAPSASSARKRFYFQFTLNLVKLESFQKALAVAAWVGLPSVVRHAACHSR